MPVAPKGEAIPPLDPAPHSADIAGAKAREPIEDPIPAEEKWPSWAEARAATEERDYGPDPVLPDQAPSTSDEVWGKFSSKAKAEPRNRTTTKARSSGML